MLFIIMKHIFAVFACVFWQGLDNNLKLKKTILDFIGLKVNVYEPIFI